MSNIYVYFTDKNVNVLESKRFIHSFKPTIVCKKVLEKLPKLRKSCNHK